MPKKGHSFSKRREAEIDPPERAYLRVGEIGVAEFGREPLHFQGAKQPANLFDTRLEDWRIRAAGPHGFAGRWFQFAARRHQSCRAVCPASSA